MHRLATVRVRITLAALVVVGTALVGGGVLLVRAQRASLTRNVGSGVQLRAREITAGISKGDIPRLLAVPRGEDNLVQVVDAKGRVVASSRNLAGDPRISTLTPDRHAYTVNALDIDEGDGPWRLEVRRVVNNGHDYTVYVAATLDRVDDSIESLERLLLISFPLLLLLLGLTTWVVTGKALRPVESIRREVERIGADDLHRRVPEPTTHDEIGRLARTMNAMLSRLEDSQDRQRRFVADASHELRSPLTGMRAELELELERPSDDGRQAITQDLLADTVRLQRLVEDLLTIAVTDASTLDADHRQPVDLDEIVLAEARHLRAHTTLDVDTSQVSGAQYEVNAGQFGRVVRNLLDNAASHANSAVNVLLRETDSAVRLVVSDDGPGVPPDARERIFERFARLDDARSGDHGGTGLGLAIVREVVEAHGGTVTVDAPPGATFTVMLPLNGTADRGGRRDCAPNRFQDELRRLPHTHPVQEPVRRRHPETGLVAATVGLLLCALVLQLLVFANGGHTALSDLPRVLLHRQITPAAPPYLVRPLEYPVLSGLMLYGADLAWPTALGAFLVTAIAAGSCCVYLTVRFARRFGSRAWRWALALPLLLFAFQNWDVFAVTALALGLLAFEQRRNRAAGIALGIGAGIKLFPLVVVPVLAAIRWREGRRDEARSLLAGATVTFLAVNLPCAVLAPHRWWWTYQFQSHRQATWGSAWSYIFRALQLPVHGAAGAQLANIVALCALLGGLAWLIWRLLRNEIGQFAAAAAAVAIFILSNKVYSPTYDVWLVAFFVMVPFSRRMWLTFCAVDLAVFITVYGYFHHLHSATVVHTLLPVFVAIRTATLVAIVVKSTRTSLTSVHNRLSAPPKLPVGETAR